MHTNYVVEAETTNLVYSLIYFVKKKSYYGKPIIKTDSKRSCPG